MIFSKISALQSHVLESYVVDVEVDTSNGLNAFSIVGLPDKAVEEAKDRVSAAIKNMGFTSPKSKNQKVVISLAPADLRKEGPNFDLAISLAYLLSVDEIRFDPRNKLFFGELSLDGSIRSIKGALALVIGAKKRGFEEIYIPSSNADEVSMISGIKIFGVRHLREIIDHLNEKQSGKKMFPILHIPFSHQSERTIECDFEDIKGQEGVKRALEIAAAGGHNIMMYGPPGTGKTMLARAFSYIIPGLSFEDVLLLTSIHSSFSKTKLIHHPPFRAPHHTSSHISLLGGGAYPKPGEVTFAHKGVLFMDEFPEFDRKVIEALRQPLEDRIINISRAKSAITFPADFILVASMNPCPCGFLGSIHKECICSNIAISNYKHKISGPIADRIDIWVEVAEISYKKLGGNIKSEATSDILKRVKRVRDIQKSRFAKGGVSHCTINGQMSAKDIETFCLLSEKCRSILDISAEKLHISPRVYHKIIKLARTIADLGNKEDIEEAHILEAFQYRPRKD